MLNVALTGNIASGKSTVARLFAEWGATVIDADRIVRSLQQPGTPTLAAIATRFGPEMLHGDGSLDRDRLRAAVFADPDARRDLNAIMHPAVAWERDRLIAAAAAKGARIVVSDIPLLFEVGDPAGFDAIVLVDAPVELRRERLMSNRHLSGEQADAMIAAQMPAESKRTRSTHVIDNDHDPGTLAERAKVVWDALTSRIP